MDDTIIEGTGASRTGVSRRWLIGAAVVSTASVYVPRAGGTLGYDVATASSAPLAAAPTPAPTLPLSKPGQLGFNVNVDMGQGSGTFLFLDRMKSSGTNGLFVENGGTYAQAPRSQSGYPTGIGGSGGIFTHVSLHAPEAGQPPIRHVLRHNGVGLKWRWDFVGNITIVDDSDPNRVIFDVAARIPGQGSPALSISGAKTWPDYRPGNPQATRDGIAVYELAHEAAYLAGEIFHPAAVADYGPHYALRFMDALKTNAVVARTVADRTPLGFVSYSANAEWGMPLEVMVALCNKVSANLWYCLPHAADDGYKSWAFAYIRDNLHPSLYLQLEYSNEVWNDGFGNQHNFAKAQGEALGGKDHNFGYGYLAAKMVRKAREVFGAASGRVLGMFARQSGYMLTFTNAALGVEALEGRKTRDYFEAASQAFYGGGGSQELVSYSAPQSSVDTMMREVAAFEASGTIPQPLVDEMSHAGRMPGWPATGSLDQLATALKDVADFCRAEGIKHHTGYEGQEFHVNANRLGPTEGLRVANLMGALRDDRRISGTQAGSYARNKYSLLRRHGMTGFMIFMDYGEPSQYGLWGSKRDVFAPATPIWNFYRWYQTNQPDEVLFEINVPGGAAGLAVGQATSRTVSTYGGLMPAGRPRLKSGTLPPGMKFADGVLSGKPTAVGSYPLVFTACDASGREITGTQVFTVTRSAALASLASCLGRTMARSPVGSLLAWARPTLS